MDKPAILGELRQAQHSAEDAARSIAIMIRAIETDVTCGAERSHAANRLANASTIIRRSYEQGW